jgi:hypothetical protein
MSRASRVAGLACTAVAGLAGACQSEPLGAVGLAPMSLATGLLGHWTFDEGSGAVAADHSGNGRNGTLTGGTWIADGRFAGALRLASGESVSVPGFPNPSASWTVSAWVRIAAADAAQGYVTVVSAEKVFEGGWEMNVNAVPGDERLHFGYWIGPALEYAFYDCYCFATDRWMHIATVVEGSARTLAFYRDGVLWNRSPVSRLILPGSPTLYFGRWSGDGRLLTGSIDDVAIYSRALVSEEIAALHEHAPP